MLRLEIVSHTKTGDSIGRGHIDLADDGTVTFSSTYARGVGTYNVPNYIEQEQRALTLEHDGELWMRNMPLHYNTSAIGTRLHEL